MEWLTCIRKTLEYMEGHLHDDISVQDISDAVNVSPMFLQKGFSIMTGYGIGEYLRNRRLYQAAIDLCNTEDKIIDIAFSYVYETPESFSKAFSRFHGATPSQIRLKEAPIKTFLPLKININISGGYQMEYKILSKAGLKVIGFSRELLIMVLVNMVITVCLLCPPPCGPFLVQDFSGGELSYKEKRVLALARTS